MLVCSVVAEIMYINLGKALFLSPTENTFIEESFEQFWDCCQYVYSQEIVSIISVGVREADAEKPKRKTPDDITRFF